MKLESRTSKAANAADRWIEQYGCDQSGIAKRIRSLGDSPTPEVVNEIIGNPSWTDCHCNECDRYVDCVVQVGDEPTYDSSTAWLCGDCIAKAASLLANDGR
jgi:hypothetical protein